MTGFNAKLSNYPNGFANGLTVRGIPLNIAHPGKVFWVHDGAPVFPNRKGPSDSAANKGSFLDPYATIDFAIGKCVANRGDIIMVAPGHSETVSTAIAVDVAGIAIVGLGAGTDRPQLTGGVAADLVQVSAANVTLYGLYWNEKTTAADTNSLLDIAASNCTVINCHFDQGTNDLLGVTVTGAGEVPHFYGNEWVVTADGPDNAIQFEGVVDQVYFHGNTFVMSNGTNGYDDGYAVSFEGNAVTNVRFEKNYATAAGVTGLTMAGNYGSVVGLYSDQPFKSSGTTDTDDSANDYTATGGHPVLTLEGVGMGAKDVWVDFDNNKATTGVLVVYTTQTLGYVVQRQVDGTNWRTTDAWPDHRGALLVADAANDLDEEGDGTGTRFYLGDLGPGEQVRINLEVSAEAGDTEIPYVLTWTGDQPLVTEVAAG